MSHEIDEDSPGEADGGHLFKYGSTLKEGERRTVTVLFSDMKGFTALSEKSDPEDMDALMSRVFARFEAIIRKHGGYVEKYIGDAMVAVFGVPELHEDDGARAIDSALEFNALLRRPPADIPAGIQFRSGIHTGLVTTGRRGSYDVVTGHTMAVASRLQAAAQPGGISVSESVRELCDKLFVFGEPQELALKGKEERVKAYPALARRKAIFDYATPFVDRKQPLEFLTAEYVRHMRGESRGVYVVGDGGLGKTRLVAEFWARLKGFPDFNATFLAVNPSSFGNAEYAALMHAAADFLDLRADASYEEFAAAAVEKARLDEAYLKDAYGLWKPEERQAMESRFAAAVGALFDAILASDGDVYPDVVFVDNARLTDERSLEFLRSYFSTAKSRPFVVLCDRVRYDPAAAVFGTIDDLALEPLPDADAAELVRALAAAGGGGLDEAAVALVVERSQGYPLFIEEYVKLIRSSSDASRVPDSIQTTILAAMDRLDPASKGLAQRLSVLRYPFDEAFAASMSESRASAVQVRACLDRLAAERILAPGQDGQWSFKHAIVREAIYSSLLLHNRRVLHAMAADLLGPAGKPADVFYHLVEADSWDEARAYLVGKRPLLPVESVPSIQKIIDHCPEDATGELIELHFLKYATFYNNKVYDGLYPIVHDMYRLALRARNRFYLARCYHLFMTSYYMSLDFRSAVLYGRKALDAYEGAGNERGAANARFFLSSCYLGLDDRVMAAEAIEGISRAEPYGQTLYENAMAMFCRMNGRHREATRWNEAIVARALSEGDEDEACRRRASMVADALYDLRFSEALADRPDRPYCGFDAQLAVPYHAALGAASRLAGDGDGAAKAFAAAAYHLAQLRSEPDKAAAAAALAWARLLAGDRKEARSAALSALESAVRCRHYAAMFQAEVSLAELALIEGDRDEFAFFTRDASMLAGAPIYKDRKTLARFWYFAWVLLESCPEGQGEAGELLCRDERDEYLAEAKTLLEGELGESAEKDRDRILGLSVFGRIMRE